MSDTGQNGGSGRTRRGPARLSSEPGPARDSLVRASPAWRADLDEGRAWQRLSTRLGEPRRSRASPRIWVIALPALGAVAAVAVAVLRARAPSDSIDSVAQSAQHATPEPAPPPSPPHEDLLPAGPTRLADGTVVRVQAGSVARTASARGQVRRLELDRGTVELEVAHQPKGQIFAVASGGYRFEVLGTQFRVTLEQGSVDLDVSDGAVAVRQGKEVVATVAAGGHWHGAEHTSAGEGPDLDAGAPPSTLESEVPKEPSPLPTADRFRNPSAAPPAVEPPHAARSTNADCLAPARYGKPREAVTCFRAVATGDDLSAQMALYEIARLERDVLADRDGAMAAINEYRQRFPQGALRGEVDLSRIELLVASGRYDEVLAESSALLTTPFGRERAAELRLLRGNVYRDGLHDCAAAEAEYAAVPSSNATAQSEARFGRARCLEAAGKVAEAIRAYDEYLALPHPAHAAEVRMRLQALGR